MSPNAVVRARVDPAIRDAAAAILADWGLAASDALRMTLTRIVRIERAWLLVYKIVGDTLFLSEPVLMPTPFVIGAAWETLQY